jgi:CRP-like cAMP-binding protein
LFDPIDLRAVTTAFSCAPELAERILGFGRIRHYAAGSHLLRQGDLPAAMYLIILGRCHALLFAADGQMVLLHELGPGDLFGALSGLDGIPEDADVVAVDEVRSFLLEAGILVSLAERDGCIGLALSRILLKRLRAVSSRMYERAALSASGRVCAELLRLAQAGGGLLIRPVPVIAELAVRVGTTRETASRTVSALERRGIIRREAAELVVVAPARLEAEIL